MSTPHDNLPGQGGNAAEVDRLLQEAETAAKAEDWEKTIEVYRKLLTFDRVIQGAEAKLQWALRMRDIDALYHQGKAELEAQHFDTALAALRKARLMYASHYKDTDALIVEAQTAMQKGNWQARPPAATVKKGCLLTGGALALFAVLSIIFLSACASAPAATPSTLSIPTAPAAPTVAAAVAPSTGAGSAAKLAPQQRSNMYKTAPAMTIDVNKTYVATIKTTKGDIVAELYPKDAPQHVNNFVFLARDGFFDNLTFHRVVAGFVIQGGDPLGTGTGGPGYNVPPEIKGKHSKGALAMARQGGPAQTTPSSGSQFYVTLDAQPSLDGQYTVFGQVTQGMDVVQKIAVGDVIQTVTIEEK
jgi:cyclophilin family peptidyl-prolyl cis-trans isomerase